ncbi:hypothetical protein ABPG75_011549 [Micractinium tetrahymenae]
MAPSASIHSLPDDLLGHIFHLARQQEDGFCKTNLAGVSRRWRATFYGTPDLWRTVRMFPYNCALEDLLEQLPSDSEDDRHYWRYDEREVDEWEAGSWLACTLGMLRRVGGSVPRLEVHGTDLHEHLHQLGRQGGTRRAAELHPAGRAGDVLAGGAVAGGSEQRAAALHRPHLTAALWHHVSTGEPPTAWPAPAALPSLQAAGLFSNVGFQVGRSGAVLCDLTTRQDGKVKLEGISSCPSAQQLLEAANLPGSRLTDLHTRSVESSTVGLSLQGCTQLSALRLLSVAALSSVTLDAPALQSLARLTLHRCSGVAVVAGGHFPALSSLCFGTHGWSSEPAFAGPDLAAALRALVPAAPLRRELSINHCYSSVPEGLRGLGCMPGLTRLVLHRARQLQDMPRGRYLASLRQLELPYCKLWSLPPRS